MRLKRIEPSWVRNAKLVLCKNKIGKHDRSFKSKSMLEATATLPLTIGDDSPTLRVDIHKCYIINVLAYN